MIHSAISTIDRMRCLVARVTIPAKNTCHLGHRAVMTGDRQRPAAYWFRALLVVLGLVAGNFSSSVRTADALDHFDFVLRSRAPIDTEADKFHIQHKSESWNPAETAIIVCDMWDAHHCLNAVRRATEMAPRMNEVLKTARQRGAIVIHAPSSCMAAYEGHPARDRALAVPRSEDLPKGISEWCHKIPPEERGTYPLDQSDGGEDDDPIEHAAWAKTLAARGLNPRAPWKRQMAVLQIDASRDYISDEGEAIWSILEQEKRPNVILLGVHTNMCVLGRPFGLRQMAQHGKHVVLMRDMTDTMYNPAMHPHVSHFTGTDLIVEHIEKWVCPTITSDQILKGTPFRFRDDRRPHLVMVTAEREYKTAESLAKFASKHLGHDFRVSQIHASPDDRNTLRGIELLDTADLLLVSARRRLLPPQQMQFVRRFVESGKPIVGIRTANHPFSLRKEPAPEGFQDWPTWDTEIIGGNYTNHYGNGPSVTLKAIAEHPILSGVNVANLLGRGSLYQVSPLRESATPLIRGSIPDKPAEPIAWTNVSRFGNRVFYTSLGHPGDFEQPEFQILLRNALQWAAGLAN